MDEAVFCDEVDDVVLLRYLHGNWEVVRRFCREVDVHGFLREHRVLWLMIYFNDVKLCACGSPDCESEELGISAVIDYLAVLQGVCQLVPSHRTCEMLTARLAFRSQIFCGVAWFWSKMFQW